MDELIGEFLTETSENLALLDLELVRLEQEPDDPELLGSIFRIVHTIKGTCGFLGLPRLEKVAHAGENVLGRIRDHELAVTPAAVSIVLEALDRIKLILNGLAEKQVEPAGDDSSLIERLGQMAASADSTVLSIEEAAQSAADAWNSTPVAALLGPSDAEVAAPSDALVAYSLPTGPSNLPIASNDAVSKAVATVPPHARPIDVEAELPAAHDGGVKPMLASQTIRVNVDLLDSLMTMVSELVLTRNQLLQVLRAQKDSEFSSPLQLLSQVTSELQEAVMKTRMQPIGNAWAKLPRMIRDLAVELGKKIDLRMLGSETELDRQVLELIKDPLTHMVRNAADHGLEAPAERLAAGKAETGRITLNAYHEGGHIVMEISDDGRGLPLDKIRRKVVTQGLATEAELASMGEQQICAFIFKPGFSTAAAVTSISGRGVGLDVVRSNIEKIGGTVDLFSDAGKGMRFIIKIPLTLAIVSALIVDCAGERFAIPQISVVELVRASARSETRIENLKNTRVLRLRDRLLPLVDLRDLLRLETKERTDEAFIVVSQAGSYTFGLIVDGVFDTEEIVVKPVSPILRDLVIYSGNTILGDGSVIMILDPNGIAATTARTGADKPPLATEEEADAADRTERGAFLVFRAGAGSPKAVPLSLVARLEEIDCAAIERSGDDSVIQYRGSLMPLIPVSPDTIQKVQGRQPVLVFADRERVLGLIVDEIVDIIEDRLELQLTSDRPGLVGSAIIGGRATDIIDIAHYLSLAFDDWFGCKTGRSIGSTIAKNRVLFVDDSPFFRNMLTPLLTAAGYDVLSVDSADRAMALCEAGEFFDVILSDIEMPGQNGFEFAASVRASSRWRETPVIALSSHASERDIAHGRSVGFTRHIPKLDKTVLLETLSDVVEGRAHGAARAGEKRQLRGAA